MDFILLPLSYLLVRGVLHKQGLATISTVMCWWGKGSYTPLLLLGVFFLNRDLGFAARACPPYLSLKSFWQRDRCRVLQAQMEEFITGSETSTTTVSAPSPLLFCCDTVWSCERLIPESCPPSSFSCLWVWKCSAETFFWWPSFGLFLLQLFWKTVSVE